jgi:hypothetical protein
MRRPFSPAVHLRPARFATGLAVLVLVAVGFSKPDSGPAMVHRDPTVPAHVPFVRPTALLPARAVVATTPAAAPVPSPATSTTVPAPPLTAALPDDQPPSGAGLYSTGTGKRIATIKFWFRLAYCETHADWDNPGRFAGGLGIYVGTWRQWGGRDFAPTPAEASIAEQIIVANRISTQGYRRPDGKLVEPVWFTGWGALPCAGRPELVALDDPRAYLPEHVAP